MNGMNERFGPRVMGRASGGFIGLMCILAASACDSGTAPIGDSALPPGTDVGVPFPIDRGDEGGQTPGTYKGLPLRLVENGGPSVTPVDGVIGVVCIGMSNSSQECQTYQSRLASDWADEVSGAVRVVNCARGGHAIEKWIDPAFDADLWESCITRLPREGIRPEQVRVLYHKAANQFTTAPDGSVLPSYPDPGSDFHAFHDHLSDFAARVPEWFPSAVAVYTSSRIYGGFAGNPGRSEPLSYEEGLALNTWLGEHGTEGGVWHGWGPYLWAPACTEGFNGSGVCYERADFVEDGVHPSQAGREKVAALIHARLLEEEWYAR